jgi:hypothetical protein
MRRARLFDGIDDNGRPYFAADRARVDDPAERTRIVGFLIGGRIVRRTTALDVDRFDPAAGRAVPMSVHTDGEWLWNAGLAYYLDRHGFAPEPEFVDHIVRCAYTAREPDEAAVQAALALLGPSGPARR